LSRTCGTSFWAVFVAGFVLAVGVTRAANAADDFNAPAAEFAKYHRLITGREAPRDAVTFALDPNVSTSGKDAYTIKSVETGVAITGVNLRSVWYGLYDLLERRGGCHWFWDGDVVPKKDAIDLSGLDAREEAHFLYRGLRYFAHRGLTRFQAEHWGLEDWKQEIDWCLKRRLNVFMLRIGQDDLFQLAFHETCAYPDSSKPLPRHGKGYDDRSLFWPLEFRGELRQKLQRYAFARGLTVPEDFGTMTHWYSRTPEDFLEKKNPPFLPQATKGYSERNGLVWDIREDIWADAYWKLTQTAVREYGTGAPTPRLLHTIGLGERRCFTNRTDNLALKIAALEKFLTRAHRDYPDAKVLLAGWDFYSTWHPDEVKALVARLDPKRDIIWDYEGDATSDNNFTKWGVVGKFPYTYSIFLAFESALDIRANYPLIEERQKIVQNDPSCQGYIFWPESSHTDTLLLRFFTANAWSSRPLPHQQVLDEFCASRYRVAGDAMKAIWKRVIPLSYLLDWGGNYGRFCTARNALAGMAAENKRRSAAKTAAWGKTSVEAPAIFALLAEIPWSDDFLRRDTVDLARTTLDRLILRRLQELADDWESWRAGRRAGDDLPMRAEQLTTLVEKMADVLSLHTDYSLAESYQRLDAVRKITNPDFEKTLFDNASNGYCQSHQYELARYWYAPRMRALAKKLATAVADGRRDASMVVGDAQTERQALTTRPLASLRPTLPRTEANFQSTMRALSLAARQSPTAPQGAAGVKKENEK